MQLLELTLPTAAENLALDEALLDMVDDEPAAPELLRLWECPEYAAILGRSGKVVEEVDAASCELEKVPILRRVSGGGTVLIGPGCLMYSLRLSYQQRPHLRLLDQAHHDVLSTTAQALNRMLSGSGVALRGTSDLALGDLKISGNSLRCKRNHLLYHGTLLYDFDLPRVQRLLKPPPRQPEYRGQREHRDFVNNFEFDVGELKRALITAWQATEITTVWPLELTQQCLQQRYLQREWNFER